MLDLVAKGVIVIVSTSPSPEEMEQFREMCNKLLKRDGLDKAIERCLK